MIKAPLDETNISPSQIIDDLTECNSFPNGDEEIGYINDYEVTFKYYSNVMRIICNEKEDVDKVKPKVEELINSMRENTEHVIIKWFVWGKVFQLQFYWEEDEE